MFSEILLITPIANGLFGITACLVLILYAIGNNAPAIGKLIKAIRLG